MSKQDLTQKYSDLIGKPEETPLIGLIEKLDSAYTYTTPLSTPDLHQFSTLVQHSLPKAKNPAEIRHWTRPRHHTPARLMVAAVAVLAMLLIAASIPLLLQAITGAAQGQTELPLSAYQDLHQSRTLSGTGITLTLEKGYADTNRVLLIYTYTLPQKYGEDRITPLGTMTVEPHFVLPDSTSGKIWNTAHDASGSKTAGVLSYDTSSITGNFSTLRLHLLVTRFLIEENISGQLPVFDGHLSFDFSLPFHPGKVLQPHQTMISGGEAITLERVVITHTETVMYFSGIQNLDALSVKQVTGGKFQQDYSMSFGGANCDPKIGLNDGCQVKLEMPHDNMNATGPWSITLVKNLSNKPNEESWTFHFHVQ